MQPSGLAGRLFSFVSFLSRSAFFIRSCFPPAPENGEACGIAIFLAVVHNRSSGLNRLFGDLWE
jgi:hypothetical protein